MLHEHIEVHEKNNQYIFNITKKKSKSVSDALG